MRKLYSLIKLFSCIVMPITVILSCNYIKSFRTILESIKADKLDILMGCIATMIGALVAVLTIYLTFPTNQIIKRRMKKSYHNTILLSNIFAGIIFLMLSLLAWLIIDNTYISLVFFLGSLANIIISSYYILMLSLIDEDKIT